MVQYYTLLYIVNADIDDSPSLVNKSNDNIIKLIKYIIRSTEISIDRIDPDVQSFAKDIHLRKEKLICALYS